MFLAFNRCLELNGGNGPFIVTQIGSAFLNEIAPSNGMVLSGMSPLRRLSTLSRKTGMIVRTVRRWRISSCRCRVVCRGARNPESLYWSFRNLSSVSLGGGVRWHDGY